MSSLVRLVARPMLAAVFVSGGLDAALHPDSRAKKAETVGPPLARSLPISLPEDPVQLVRINGAVQVGAGLMLATGRMPRLAALLLAGSVVPTTIAGHAFWAESDPTAKKQQRTHFLKNVGLLGGLLIASVDTGGRPTLAHLAGDALHDRKAATHHAAHHATQKARRLLPTS